MRVFRFRAPYLTEAELLIYASTLRAPLASRVAHDFLLFTRSCA